MAKLKKNVDAPASFSKILNINYLGSPTVVERILGEFIESIVGWIMARSRGELLPEQMIKLVDIRGREFSAVFSGDNKDYVGIVGWNTRHGGLSSKLMVELGTYWITERVIREDDPYRVLFDWLLWSTFEAMKHDDDIIMPMKMGWNIKNVTQILTDTDRKS